MERNIMYSLPNLKSRPQLFSEDVRATFFKCVRWQVEETLDPVNCPYHYFCESTYPGNYPAYVDKIVFCFVAASFLATLVIMVMNISTRGRIVSQLDQKMRYLLPSGPISLPLTLLVLAKGYRIDTAFPLSCISPAILQLLQVSALAFDFYIVGNDVKYVFFEASMVSGILHASLYVDSIVLPYHTGFDALVSSTFSGECESCVCRTDALVVGGKLINYRGWSLTTFIVVLALCSRIICRFIQEKKMKVGLFMKYLLECLSWFLITLDCIYLVQKAPPERHKLRSVVFGCILVLICLHVIKYICYRILKRYKSNDRIHR